MAKMTRMQQKIYDYIAQALREQGYPPSVREIGEAVGLKSPSTVHFHLKHMEELGVLTKGAGKGRALTLAQPMQGEMPDGAPVQEEAAPAADRIPVVGTVAAGSPILAEECIEDYLTFDTGGREGEYFALRVRGESMLNAGILPDDLVVVHRQPTAHNGEIVVARLGDEATSSGSAAGMARCGCCRRTRTTGPSTAARPRCWARSPPWCGSITERNKYPPARPGDIYCFGG